MRALGRAGVVAASVLGCLLLLGAVPPKGGPVAVDLDAPQDAPGLVEYKGAPPLNSKAFPMLSGRDFFVARLDFSPGRETALPPTPGERFAYVLRGSGEVRVNGAASRIEQGTMLLFPAGASVSLRASEPTRILGIGSLTSAGDPAAAVQQRPASDLSRFGSLPAGQKPRTTRLMGGGSIRVYVLESNGGSKSTFQAKTGTLYFVTSGAVAFKFQQSSVPAKANSLVRVHPGTRFTLDAKADGTSVLLMITVK